MSLHCIHNLFDTCVLALFPRFQYNRQLGTSLITAYTRTASRHILNIFYVWILFQISNSTIGHYARTFQSCSLRQFQFNLEVTLVLYGQKTSRNNTMNQHYGYQHHTESAQHPARMLDSPGNGSYIFITANT